MNVQAERQFGYSRDELVGRSLKTIIPEVGSIGAEVERRVAEAMLLSAELPVQPLVSEIELTGRRKDGRALPIEITWSVLRGAEGTLMPVAIRDMTTHKKAQAQLQQTVAELNRSNEELAQFAYLASHDLQEPLRMVASYTQLLSRRYKGRLDSDADEFIAFAVDGANRMQRLIQALLAYSRVGAKGNQLSEASSEDAFAQAVPNLGGAIDESGALVTHDALPTCSRTRDSWCSSFRTWSATRSSTRGRGAARARVVDRAPIRSGRSRCVTTASVSSPSTSSASSGCFSDCTSARNLQAQASGWRSARRSWSSTGAASRSSRSRDKGPPFGSP